MSIETATDFPTEQFGHPYTGSPHEAAFAGFTDEAAIQDLQLQAVADAGEVGETIAAYRYFEDSSTARKQEIDDFINCFAAASADYKETAEERASIKEAVVAVLGTIRNLRDELAFVATELHTLAQRRKELHEEKQKEELALYTAQEGSKVLRQRIEPFEQVDRSLEEISEALAIPLPDSEPAEPYDERYTRSISQLRQDLAMQSGRAEDSTARLAEIAEEIAQIDARRSEKVEVCQALRVKRSEVLAQHQELRNRIAILEAKRIESLNRIRELIRNQSFGELMITGKTSVSGQPPLVPEAYAQASASPAAIPHLSPDSRQPTHAKVLRLPSAPQAGVGN
ncbi:MAG TPA: hypothetical protein VFH39_00965 [Candidatus Saccharimonadales bacterium]|nr:hypothetical protein [Candidatus Saccharimonadales bacterium]